MEAFLTLALIVVGISLMVQHGKLSQLQRQLLDARADIQTWTRWIHGFYGDALKQRDQLESLTKRIEQLEQARLAQPQTAHTAAPAVASPPVPSPETLSMPIVMVDAAPETVAAVTEPRSPSVAPTTNEVPEPTLAAPATFAISAGTERATIDESVDWEATVAAPIATPPPVAERPVAAPPDAPAPESAPEPAPEFRPRFDWESLIGVRLFSAVAGLSLLLGAIFFLRYSVENGWLSPPIRMGIGFIVGILLLAVCEFKGRNYRVTANAMDAAGIGTLFATSFAGNAVWHLIPPSVAFLLLVLVTALAVLLSLRRNSLFIAMLGLVGGFATPVLLSTGENRPFGLFGYLLLLNVGLGLLGYRKRWPLLLSLSMGLTTLYQWGWVGKFAFNDPQQLPIAVGVFLLFPVVWVVMHRGHRRQPDELPEWVSELISWGSALPLLLALAMAWMPEFGQRYQLMFGYLLVLDLGLLVLDLARPKDNLANIAACATVCVWLGWLGLNYTPDAWPLVLAMVSVFVLLFLGAEILRKRRGARPSPSRLAAPVLLASVAMLVLVEPATASPFLLFGALLAVFCCIAAVAIGLRDGWLYYCAVPFVVVAQACWSTKWLTPDRLLAGLLVYVALALAFIAVPLVARRLSRPLTPAGLTAVVAPLNLTLLLFLAFGTVAEHSLWMIGLLLTLLNVGAFIEARFSRQHWPALVGIGLSWVIIVAWWSSAISQGRLLAALVVVVALVLLSVGGILWLRSARDTQAPDTLMDQGPLLGLIGHLFLLFVATQASLNSPPWSLFAITLVLDLALIAATLYLGRALFGAAGLCLTVLILGVWVVATNGSFAMLNAAEVALAAMLLIAGLATLLPWMAERRGLDVEPFAKGRNVILLLCQILFVELGALTEPPRLLGMVFGQLVVMGLLMYPAARRAQHPWVLGSWIVACASELTWAIEHLDASRFGQLLAMALVPYALLTGYPIFCHRQGKVGRWPFALAICGALGFFPAGYAALKASPLAGYLGALPLAESLVLAGLLVFLLKVAEPAPPRDIGRLALVAAVALGFATTAIPLQLENEWLTIAWALEAAVVAWLYRRLRHSGLIAASFGLATAVSVRLAANPEVLLYHTRSSTPILNFYLYTYLVSAIALYLASWYLANSTEARWPWLNKTAYIQRAFATILLFALLNIEIADFYSEGSTIRFRFSSTLAQDLSYTLGWAMFAIGMLVTGILLKGRAARIAALALLTLTIAKCFLHDLWRLGGLYRVGSFVGLALCLALVAIMLQRFVLKTPRSEDES